MAQERLDALAPCPPAVEYLWEYFLEMHNRRRNYGWGATHITFDEIKSWCDLRKIRLDAWELDTLIKVDDKFMAVWAKDEARKRPNGS